MDTSQHTAAIILAAGTSSRMGTTRNKLLLPLRDRPVLGHVIEAVLGSSARPIVLVLGHEAAKVRTSLPPDLRERGIEIVENTAYERGQSTSMQTGLRALLARHAERDVTGVIFVLGDQPLISSALIDTLIQVRIQTAQRIVLPLYKGQRGTPVVFSLDLAPELFQVSGDEGGRSLLKKHPHEIATVAIDEEAANFDVDTWEAYEHVQAAWQQKTLE